MKSFIQYLNENTDQPTTFIDNESRRIVLNKEYRHRKGVRPLQPGDVIYLNNHNQLHRFDGPAIEEKDGSKEWFLYDVHDRLDDGPTVIGANGFTAWHKNDKYHREDGPAIISSTGYKMWYYDGWEVNKSIDIPESLQLAMIADDPKNISLIKNPTKKIIKYLIDNYPWILTDNDFTRCPKSCEDLKQQWSRIRKARKQIGL